jgi:hypothetical protein
VHRLDARQQDPCTLEGFEAQHRSSDALDRTMVLLDNVVQVFTLPHLNAGCVLSVVTVDRCSVSAAFVECDLIGLTMLLDRPFQKAAICEQEVHRGTKTQMKVILANE